MVLSLPWYRDTFKDKKETLIDVKLLTSMLFRTWKKSNDILLIIRHVSGISMYSTVNIY